MTYEELLNEVRRLPAFQRLRLIQDVEQFALDSFEPDASPDGDSRDEADLRETWKDDRARVLKGLPPDSSLHRILGALRTTAYVPMTEEEVREEITDYLMWKHM
ncbi:MAG: hypothetical protein ACR2M3_21975 [Thermomicrobiales bacterium]